MKVVFAPEAEADLQATLEFIAERNPGAALKLARQVFTRLRRLSSDRVDGPRHQLTTGETVRSWLIPPFRVYYQRRKEALWVLRLYQHARRPLSR